MNHVAIREETVPVQLRGSDQVRRDAPRAGRQLHVLHDQLGNIASHVRVQLQQLAVGHGGLSKRCFPEQAGGLEDPVMPRWIQAPNQKCYGCVAMCRLLCLTPDGW